MREAQSTRLATSLALLSALLSMAAVLYVGWSNPSPLLIVLFLGWVTAPFAVLIALDRVRLPWVSRSQQWRYFLGYALSPLSLATYWSVASGHSQAKPAFWFLIMPLVSLVLIALVLVLAGKGESSRDD